jgi:hypothetical protein
MEITPEEFASRVLELVGAGLKAPLLDRAGCAKLIGISIPTLNRLRKEPGFPELEVYEAPRFERDAVLSWMRARHVRRSQERAAARDRSHAQ